MRRREGRTRDSNANTAPMPVPAPLFEVTMTTLDHFYDQASASTESDILRPEAHPRYDAGKSAADLVLAGLLLVLNAPLLLVLLALVRLTSRGPALYSQVRLGL